MKKYTQVLVVLNGLHHDGWVGMLLGTFIFKAPQAILHWNWPQDNPIILKDYLSLLHCIWMFYHKSFYFFAKCLLECLLSTFDYFVLLQRWKKSPFEYSLMDLTGNVVSCFIESVYSSLPYCNPRQWVWKSLSKMVILVQWSCLAAKVSLAECEWNKQMWHDDRNNTAWQDVYGIHMFPFLQGDIRGRDITM